MSDWNVVVTIASGHYRQALELLAPFGQAQRSGFYNVLTLKTGDIPGFLETLRQALAADQRAADLIGKAIPCPRTFTFQSPEEFMARAAEALEELAPAVAGQGFHVRLHRRGFKGRISTPQAEQALDDLLLAASARLGRTAQVTFSDPQVIVALETVGTRAGVSLWDREQRLKYPFLRLD